MKPTTTYSRKGLKRTGKSLSTHARLSSSPSPEPVSEHIGKRRKVAAPEPDRHSTTSDSRDRSKYTSSTPSVKSLEPRRDNKVFDDATSSGSRAIKKSASSSNSASTSSHRSFDSARPNSGDSPTKLARNISQVSLLPNEEDTSAHVKKPPARGIMKRMLSRSQSGTSQEASQEIAYSNASYTNTSTSSLGREPTVLIQDNDTTDVSMDAPGSQPTTPQRPKHLSSNSQRTYAGRSRSYVVPLGPADTLLNQSQEDEDDGFGGGESYTDLRLRWGVDNSEDDPYLPALTDGNDVPLRVPLRNGMMNDLKSITELRSKGESRRFLDEVGYLFEGLNEQSNIGVRRTSALELITKLCDSEFARKATTADFLERTWDVLCAAGGGSGDKVLDILLALYAALVARDKLSIAELSRKEDFVATLASISCFTHLEKDFLKLVSSVASDAVLRNAGMPKTEKRLILVIRGLIEIKSDLFDNTAIPSTRLLISHALATLPPSYLSYSIFPKLLKSLVTELDLVQSRFSAYTAGLSFFPSDDNSQDMPSFHHIANCLKMFDTALLSQWKQEGDQTSDHLQDEDIEGVLRRLLTLSLSLEAILLDQDSRVDISVIENCMELSLRILITLSHQHPNYCETICQIDSAVQYLVRLVVKSQRQRSDGRTKSPPPEPSKPPSTESAILATDPTLHAFDQLCLGLGLLTNIISGAPSATSRLLQKLKIDPSCPGTRACLRTCRCVHPINGLESLVGVYEQQQSSAADGEIDADSSFIRGHITILLGLLMRSSETSRSTILEALGKRDAGLSSGTTGNNINGFRAFVAHAAEFVEFYDKVTQRILRSSSTIGHLVEHEDEGEDHTTSKNNSTQNSQSENAVAREVLEYLRTCLS